MAILHFNRGRCLPLGASLTHRGVNFAVLTRHGTSVSLAILDEEGASTLAEIPLHPLRNRTGDHWHIEVVGLPEVFCYGWRVDGPQGKRHAFDPSKILLDPASTAVSGGATWGKKTPFERRSVFIRNPYDWEGDVPPIIALEDSILYELHVRGFTIHPSSMTVKPGTFAALVEKIPYLLSLGVTAVELLPIHEFDENECPFENPVTGEKLVNFWGYNTIAFAAPKASYAATGDRHGQVGEFRDMVRAFHQAGLEIFLDVVFNHTGEGNQRGKTLSFRGLDNEVYYLMDSQANYLNYSGCGNTVNCNHPLVRDLILTCLRFWVADMHVDGLRFDLASILGRDRQGRVLVDPPVVETIAEDGVLADTKLIAEPWDAAGLYQVGGFPFGRRWSEWNGQYRDIVRRFWRGEPGTVGPLATKLCGSADLYQTEGRGPRNSINFITCHDGFTLWDLTSYEAKHNDANGEESRDGCPDNHSFNCGVEGITSDPWILELRSRQARNLMATLLLSQGVPMLLGGDEFLRTQGGNNNAWCQDNSISWLDWSCAEAPAGASFLRFTKLMIAFRKRQPALRRRTFLDSTSIQWHGFDTGQADFSTHSQFIALALDGSRTSREPGSDIYMAFNAHTNSVEAMIPLPPSARTWRRVVDTGLLPPLDIHDANEGPLVLPLVRYMFRAHSVVVLVGVD